jgi:UDP-N-acetylglucosamine--N-acetylmuramyl-(pentapeptide) pyrophosphoryl-undecaprenol N-acetylglucosamine transferase
MAETTEDIRVAITGGGTGGHVSPALAVVDELRQRGRLRDALWIGSHDGLEGAAAAEAQIPFVAIPTGKLRRYLSLRNLTDAARVPLGMIAARGALRAFRPDVIFSTGGFVSVPTVVAARGIAPVLTHEQTAVLGLATRINARFAAVLAVSHAKSAREAQRIHRRVELTGNPVRRALGHGDRNRGLARLGFDRALPLVYVTGGARGASPINERIACMLPELLQHAQVLHQTGPASANGDGARLAALRESLPESQRWRYRVVDYIRDELPDVYAASDLVVGRAGAGTIAELAAVGKPALLIPLPGAGGDEQTANASVLSDIGAAVVIAQHEATPERLLRDIRSLLADPERRLRMSQSASQADHPAAAADIADVLLVLAPRSARKAANPR